jgi:hypothetical protein
VDTSEQTLRSSGGSEVVIPTTDAITSSLGPPATCISFVLPQPVAPLTNPPLQSAPHEVYSIAVTPSPAPAPTLQPRSISPAIVWPVNSSFPPPSSSPVGAPDELATPMLQFLAPPSMRSLLAGESIVQQHCTGDQTSAIAAPIPSSALGLYIPLLPTEVPAPTLPCSAGPGAQPAPGPLEQTPPFVTSTILPPAVINPLHDFSFGSPLTSLPPSLPSSPAVPPTTCNVVPISSVTKVNKPFSSAPGSTVWFKASSPLQCETPPVHITVQAGEFYLHKNTVDNTSKLWMMENLGQWKAAVEGSLHPTIRGRRLRILKSGEPSWITSASYAVEKYRRTRSNKGGGVNTSVVCSLS